MGQHISNLNISKEKGVDINDGMIGLFFEDINYNVDGGIHAELIENRNFEFLDSRGDKDAYYQTYDGGYGWTAYPVGETGAKLEYLTEEPMSKVNPHYLEFTGVEKQLGFANKAYDGIYLEKEKTYHLSFYAKAKDYNGTIRVEVLQNDISYGTVNITEPILIEWKKFTATFTAKDTVRYGDFVISLTKVGCVDFDCISLIPEDAVHGVFRPDLLQLLKDIKPGFLRFPGGCIVEGNELDNRYRWKESIGPLEDRRNNWNRWAVHGNREENNYTSPYSHYNQTLGIGYYEYFLLSEYLRAKPIPVLNVGLACQYQSTQKVAVESDAFQEYIQDALDLIEFANGDETTKWGNIRVQMGHKEPFSLEYLGIGNEQWETEAVDYFRRYECFEAAIHHQYPEIKLISSAGPNVKSDTYDAAWTWMKQKVQEIPNFTAAIDEHYYVPPTWCYENTDFYDNYSRDVKVFAGEYAAHVGNGMNRPEVNSMEAALAEAAFMTGLERNADVVHLAAYAPLLARLDYTQWSPDLIWFNDCAAYGTPSYYVQKMYGNHMGSYTLKSNLKTEGDGLYTTVSYDEPEKEMIIKLVNSNSHSTEVGIHIDEAFQINQMGKIIELSSEELTVVNDIINPQKIAPIEKRIDSLKNDFTLELSPYSFYIVRIKTK